MLLLSICTEGCGSDAGGQGTTGGAGAASASAGTSSTGAAATGGSGAGAGAGAGGSSSGGGAAPTALPLGTISDQGATECVIKGPGTLLPGAACRKLMVDCPDIEPLGAVVAVVAPDNPKGTIVLHDGGGGETFFGRNDLVQRYLDAGFRIVEMEWDSAWEASASHPSIKSAACRPATVMQWVFDEIQGGSRTEGFCGQGQSGGSGVMSYALAAYGLGDILDYVMITSGPPFGRMDCGCGSTAADCAIPDGFCPELTSEAIAAANHLPSKVADWEGIETCGPGATDEDYAKYRADSVASPDALFEYPQTLVDAFYCAMNPNPTPAGGALFLSKVTTEGGAKPAVHCSPSCSVESIYQADNALSDGTLVSDAMVDLMTSKCTPRHP
ncbi:MAG: hypothetical protein WKG00_04180 [Polyangiaceae bacterium]